MITGTTSEPISVSALLGEPLRSMLNPVEPAFQKLLAFDRLRQVFDDARRSTDANGAVAGLLERLNITWHLDAAELDRVPRTGPVIAVANHPFGLLEGAVLSVILPKIRPDVRILTNSVLAGVPDLRERCIFINPFGEAASVSANAGALRECLAWLDRGGLLVTFPAGEVAHMNWKDGVLADPPWNPPIARLARISGADALPIFFRGANSAMFHLAGAVHARLRTAALPRELLNKRGRRIEVRIGRPVSHRTLEGFADAREAIEYLRCRTYLLDRGGRFAAPWARFVRQSPIVSAAPESALANDIERLPAGRLLSENGDLAVYVGGAAELPNVVREIGRLREIAFRGAGEGTGRAIDLDRFDRYYQHLVLWNRGAREVAGAYRLGPTPDILPRYGIAGLYTSTLFRYRKDLFERMGPAVELGRSFVRPEYQKQYAPLLLLWKGIGRYVAGRPECAVLFGGVSISYDYHAVSRHLLVKFLEAHRVEELAGLVAPRHPYRPDERLFRRTGLVSHVPEDLDELSSLIAGLEADGKGVPILVKQYWKAGGRLLGFNVDRGFANALDALILVDLRTAPDALLERYLGKPGAAVFSAWHSTVGGAA